VKTKPALPLPWGAAINRRAAPTDRSATSWAVIVVFGPCGGGVGKGAEILTPEGDQHCGGIGFEAPEGLWEVSCALQRLCRA